MEGQKRTRQESPDSPNKSDTHQTPKKRIDFATGDGLQRGDSSTSQAARTKEVPTHQQVEHSEPPTAQQDTQEDSAMERFLDKKTLEKTITSNVIKSMQVTYNYSSGKSREIYKHILTCLQILRNYSQYDNTSKEEATNAYKEMKEWYRSGNYDGTYRDTAKNRCKSLGFPFAQS